MIQKLRVKFVVINMVIVTVMILSLIHILSWKLWHKGGNGNEDCLQRRK